MNRANNYKCSVNYCETYMGKLFRICTDVLSCFLKNDVDLHILYTDKYFNYYHTPFSGALRLIRLSNSKREAFPQSGETRADAPNC